MLFKHYRLAYLPGKAAQSVKQDAPCWQLGGELGVRGCCVCRLLALGQDPLQAVSGARLHHQLLPDLVRAEHWNVSSVTGPSFMVTHAELEVHLPTQMPCCAQLLPERRASIACFLSKSKNLDLCSIYWTYLIIHTYLVHPYMFHLGVSARVILHWVQCFSNHKI